MKQTTEARAEARFSHEKPYPDQFSAKYGYATCIREEVEPLEAWKESAIKVMGEWDKVWTALGNPGKLGESTAAASLVAVERLRALVQRFVDHNTKWLGKGCLDADIQWDAIISDCQEQGFVPTNTEDNG